MPKEQSHKVDFIAFYPAEDIANLHQTNGAGRTKR